MNGIIVVNKEENYTSRDIVNIVSKALKTKKVGHTGTLDPMATGVLVICVGKATKLVEILMDHDKEYIAEVCLGVNTDTLDITGNILNEEDINVSKEDIINVLDSYIKTYDQEVPVYSAVKVKGKKLYEYARNNKEVKLPKKKVTIHDIKLIGDVVYKDNKTYFKIKTRVSKGTYIRSLIRDIGKSLNTYGCMTSLIRTRVGDFSISDAISLDDIKNNNIKMMDTKLALTNYKQVTTDTKLENKIKNGSIIPNIYNEEEILFLDQNGNLLALYKKYDKNPDFLKPWKMLV